MPLTRIVLEFDAKHDALTAIGTMGADVYKDYFRAFKRELIEQFGRGKAKREVMDQTIVMRDNDYTSQLVRC